MTPSPISTEDVGDRADTLGSAITSHTAWRVLASPTDPEMYAVVGAYLVADNLPIEDAKLIAAAPEMLGALVDLLQAYSEPDRRLCCDGRDCGCMGSTVRDQAEYYAREAIAKAEGRSPSSSSIKGEAQ